ncbi:23S rRNA (adenine(1618)-N(6))-methyltransferase RlmF [Luteimonas yindakuii]|uniref:23S rRNA (adenine(1618)-N(6))-methyltransferase RlmF n=1 Tax=Luteimonas yindakuii TaxID=2565782 RepID=UPI0011077D1A|nr:23S rRNA (adenine(1618)-N(6))-methyltransferase RlmF [Luteimonas yindakuii]QCU72531.1 23S rRNA (adenine(1618)-N(6))-methyltransferase RlmF [Luteimonas yindakuii]
MTPTPRRDTRPAGANSTGAGAATRPALHPRNRHQGRYDFARLLAARPALSAYMLTTPRGDTSIDFGNPMAVRELNRAILHSDYGIAHWDLPDGALCPPIPGRADYLHGLADLLAVDPGDGTIPRGMSVRALDVGVGASCIYPLLGHAEYGWRFTGTDIDATSLQVAAAIVHSNRLDKAITLRQQPRRGNVFRGVVADDDRYDVTLCNPPFHASATEAAQANQRKRRQLGGAGAPATASALNFGGHAHELWYEGGEAEFLRRMVRESVGFGAQVLWFSSLVAKSAHLPGVRRQLREAGALEVREVAMAQGSKQSRFVAWSFMDSAAREAWRATRR